MTLINLISKNTGFTSYCAEQEINYAKDAIFNTEQEINYAKDAIFKINEILKLINDQFEDYTEQAMNDNIALDDTREEYQKKITNFKKLHNFYNSPSIEDFLTNSQDEKNSQSFINSQDSTNEQSFINSQDSTNEQSFTNSQDSVDLLNFKNSTLDITKNVYEILKQQRTAFYEMNNDYRNFLKSQYEDEFKIQLSVENHITYKLCTLSENLQEKYGELMGLLPEVIRYFCKQTLKEQSKKEQESYYQSLKEYRNTIQKNIEKYNHTINYTNNIITNNEYLSDIMINELDKIHQKLKRIKSDLNTKQLITCQENPYSKALQKEIALQKEYDNKIPQLHSEICQGILQQQECFNILNKRSAWKIK